MNWLHFSLWVCGIYMLYYLVIILTDLSRGRSPTKTNHELSFSGDVRPELLKAEDHAPAARPGPSMIGSGGVSLKETFGLARKDMLVYTRAVSFG